MIFNESLVFCCGVSTEKKIHFLLLHLSQAAEEKEAFPLSLARSGERGKNKGEIE
jgi:hypothetical protein